MDGSLRSSLLLASLLCSTACAGPQRPAAEGEASTPPKEVASEAAVLEGPHGVSGKVSDPAGAPAASAVVSVALLGPEGTLASMMSADLYLQMRRAIPGSEVLFKKIWKVTTDAAGHFQLEGLPEGHYSLWAGEGATASAERLAHLSSELPREAIELALAEPILLRGVVKTEGGAPAPGATVGIVTGDTELPDRVSGSDGSFEAMVSPERSVHLLAQLEGWVAAPILGADPDGAVQVVLYRPRSVRGSVVQEGEPVAGVTIQTDAPGIEGKTGEDGTFLLADLPGRSFRLRAAHEKLGRSVPQIVDVTEKSIEGLEIELVPLPALVVQVNDETGAPLAGAKVALLFYGANVPPPLEGLTGEDGRWTFEAIPAASMYGATATAEGRASAHTNIALQPGRRTETTLTLKPAHPVLVRVSRPETVTRSEALELELAGIGGGALWHHTHEAPVAEGTATRVEGVAPGTYLARVWSAEVTSRPVEVAVPGPEVELVLQPATSLLGRVVDAAGAPMAGVVVEAWHPDWPSPDGDKKRIPPRWSRSAVSEADGRFRLTGVGSGDWLAVVRTHGPVRKLLCEPEAIGTTEAELRLEAKRPEPPPKMRFSGPVLTTANDYRMLCGAVEDLLADPGFERMPVSGLRDRHSEFRRRWKRLQEHYEKRSPSEAGSRMVRSLGQVAPDQRYDMLLGSAKADGVKGKTCPEVVRVWTPGWVDAAGTFSWDLYLLCDLASAMKNSDPLTVQKRMMAAFEEATRGTAYPHPGRAAITRASKLPKKQRYRALLAAARKAGIKDFACPSLKTQWESD